MSNWIIKNSRVELWGLVHKKHTSSACENAYLASMLENHQRISCKLQTQNSLNLDQCIFLLTQKYVLWVVAAEEVDACIHKWSKENIVGEKINIQENLSCK